MSARTRKNAPPPVEGQGPWLIRSHYWKSWHRRNSDGGASGYTDDIAYAGLFDFRVAKGYHDPGGRDQAIPISKHLTDLRKRLVQMTAERDAFSAEIERVRAILSAKASNPSSPTEQVKTDD